jgi:hypothetical protein
VDCHAVTVQGASTSAPTLPPSSPASNGSDAKQQFSAKAQAMSMRMSHMANRISELTRMARQSTMFEDNSVQINQLTSQVKAGLQSLVRATACHATRRSVLSGVRPTDGCHVTWQSRKRLDTSSTTYTGRIPCAALQVDKLRDSSSARAD